MVALISGRIFIGREKNRDPAWLHTAIQYTTDAFISAEYLRILPGFLRPLGALIIPEVRRCRKHLTVAKNIIGPLIQARASGQEKPGDDMVQWMVDSATTPEEREITFISQQFLVISFASIHSTTVALTKILYDLASRQEYIKPLREELEAALREEGGVFTRQSVQKMELMDSFLKESQRLSPPQTSRYPLVPCCIRKQV
jgi:cytochrome P450